MLKTWNTIKSMPGYGWMYQRLSRIEDRYPTAPYFVMAWLLMLPLVITAGLER